MCHNLSSYYIIILISSVLFISFPGIGQDDPTISHVYCSKATAHKHFFSPQDRSNPLTESYDLKYYRFEWFIDPNNYKIQGTATSYFQVKDAAISEINFDFSKQLNIDSIVWHGQKLNYVKNGNYGLSISFPTTIEKNTLDSISISYNGAPPSSGLGSFTKSTHAGSPIIWTLSAPFGSQDWWPCKNGLEDKIDSLDVIITTPNKYRAASIGVLIKEDSLTNQNNRYHWKHRYPIAPYLVAFAVTNYATFNLDVPLKDSTTMPMVNYVYPESLASAKTGIAKNVQVLQFFDSLFVSYPFSNEKYGHAQFGFQGGMEHQTMSYVLNFDYGLLAHELAHQWFGDFVTCGSWEDVWLNEGFATYLEGLTRERFESNNNWRNWKKGKISNIISSNSGSVKVDNLSNVNRIYSDRLTYNKGGMVLHALRKTVGDESFFTGVRNFLNDKAFNFAVTNDLKTHLELASNKNLDTFFQTMFEGQGFPIYEITWSKNSTGVDLNINQKTSHSSVSFYDLPLLIRIKGEDNQVIDLNLRPSKNEESFDIQTDFEVKSVEFNPEFDIICRSTVKNIITNSVETFFDSPFVITPNPVSNFLSVTSNKMDKNDQYQIYDMIGNEVLSGKINNEQNQKIDVSNLKQGAYIIRISSEKNKALYKQWIKI